MALIKFPSHFPWKSPLKLKPANQQSVCCCSLIWEWHSSPGAHPTSGLAFQMKKNTKTDWEIPTLFRTKEMNQMQRCTEVPKKTQLARQPPTPSLYPCPLDTSSAIHGIHGNKMQLQEDVAVLMREENREKLVGPPPVCDWESYSCVPQHLSGGAML